ncbi:MAG: DUF448 domain-containing protein [Propionibacteriaceae bacterium]|nr:DUF448 domain-containing protein [Propionibacteriaceae bacterium]
MTPPVRTCLGCRGKAVRSDLVRLAWDARAGVVVIDHRLVLGGRGCYLHPACAAPAARRGVIGRALRRPVDSEQVAAVLAGLATTGPA